MKKYLVILFGMLLMNNAFAQEKKAKFETAVIQTSAECGDCKDRLEEAMNYLKGVKFAELDLETMKLTVKYSPSKLSLQEIKEKISSIGYDADEVKANQDAVQKLPACCQPGGMKKH